MPPFSIEGIPLITRFKTQDVYNIATMRLHMSIEGIPLITRFKTDRDGLRLYP